MATVNTPLHDALRDIGAFSRLTLPQHAMRSYQLEAAKPLAHHLLHRTGEQFAIAFSRQAGKDEMLAQVISWVLVRNSECGGTIVIAAPTLRPQAMISRDRLRDRLLANPLTAGITKVSDRTIHVGRAKAVFVSAAKTANARGLTADLGLIANEAQDISPSVWDAVFDPMAASTNATALVTARQRVPMLQISAQIGPGRGKNAVGNVRVGKAERGC